MEDEQTDSDTDNNSNDDNASDNCHESDAESNVQVFLKNKVMMNQFFSVLQCFSECFRLVGVLI